MNDELQLNEEHARSAAGREPRRGGRKFRSDNTGLLRSALILNVVLWLSLSCSGDIGSVMGLDDPALQIAGVHVEPASISLEVGDSEVLSARYSDGEGNQHPEEVTWSSSNPEIAAVDQDGQVAAHAPGTTVIIASNGEGEDGSAEVEVVDEGEGSGSDESDSDSDTSSQSHEPDGFRGVTERPFNEAVEDGWSTSGGIDLQIVSDASAPRSPSNVGRIRYPAGFDGGRTPTFTTRSGLRNEGFRELYISFWMKVSDNWQGHESRVNKIGYAWLHGQPVVVPNNDVKGSGAITPTLRLENTPDGARNLDANVDHVEIERGEWHRWEILLVVNSGDSHDGEAHWWIDGQKAGEYTQVTYGSSGQSKSWETVAWRPTWGGIGDVVDEEMYLWMDHFYVSGSD